MKKNEHILKSIIEECKKHLKRMNYAYEKMLPLFPFTEKQILKLNDEKIALTDQMIYESNLKRLIVRKSGQNFEQKQNIILLNIPF
ncbi:MAG TPA: hypothetical protein ENI76_07565 [Ignavibacteria bacterium]|nr:hypothetical protein [Ignavibacteria bacterium]